MAFPVGYGLLLAFLLFRLFRAPFFLLPLAAAVADALENATVAALALSHAGAPSPLAWPAAVFTLAKTALFCAALAAICVGAIRWLRVRVWGADRSCGNGAGSSANDRRQGPPCAANDGLRCAGMRKGVFDFGLWIWYQTTQSGHVLFLGESAPGVFC